MANYKQEETLSDLYYECSTKVYGKQPYEYDLPFYPSWCHKRSDYPALKEDKLGYNSRQYEKEIDETPLMPANTFRSFASVRCASPVIVRIGENKVYVSCGKCPLCLARRRQEWSKRLEDETKHPRHWHAFGITLTYDGKHIPYLTAEELAKGQFKYIRPNKSHSYLALHRGCSAASLAREDNIGLLNTRDMDQYFRKVRKFIEKRFPWMYLRYYFNGEYGDIDDLTKVDIKKARTARPHYHGIFYLGYKSKDPKDIEFYKELNEKLNAKKEIEQFALDAWHHCKQRWDARKGMFVCKSIQKFGQNWGYYLGKYVSKEDLSTLTGAKGALYVPQRIWCSRRSTKFDLGSLGYEGYKGSTSYRLNYRKLITSVVNSSQFIPTYNQNGYTKRVPRAYYRNHIVELFGVSMTDIQRYRRLNRLGWYDPSSYRPKPSKDVRKYKQRSISCAPLYEPWQLPLNEPLKPTEYYWYDPSNPLAYQYKLAKLHNWQTWSNAQALQYLALFGNDTSTAFVYDDAGWHSTGYLEPAEIRHVLKERSDIVRENQQTLKASLDYKFKHAYRNGYCKQIIVNNC